MDHDDEGLRAGVLDRKGRGWGQSMEATMKSVMDHDDEGLRAGVLDRKGRGWGQLSEPSRIGQDGQWRRQQRA